MRPIPLLLLLFSSVVHAQAVAPPPRPPAVRPVVNAPAFPVPGATPAGAGVAVPMPDGTAAAVSRSPNKRLLPPTKEVGLWAADGARASISPPRLFGVEIPFPKDATTDGARGLTIDCVKEMAEAAGESGMADFVAGFSPDVRQCIAMHTYAHCAIVKFELTEKVAAELRGYDAAFSRHMRSMAHHAKALADAACHPGVMMGFGPDVILGRIEDVWTDNLKKRNSP